MTLYLKWTPQAKGYRESEFTVYDNAHPPEAEHVSGSIILDKNLQLTHDERGKITTGLTMPRDLCNICCNYIVCILMEVFLPRTGFLSAHKPPKQSSRGRQYRIKQRRRRLAYRSAEWKNRHLP